MGRPCLLRESVFTFNWWTLPSISSISDLVSSILCYRCACLLYSRFLIRGCRCRLHYAWNLHMQVRQMLLAVFKSIWLHVDWGETFTGTHYARYGFLVEMFVLNEAQLTEVSAQPSHQLCRLFCFLLSHFSQADELCESILVAHRRLAIPPSSQRVCSL